MTDPQARRPSRSRTARIDKTGADIAELQAKLAEKKAQRAALLRPITTAQRKQKNYDLTQLGIVAAGLANKDPDFRAKLIAHAHTYEGRIMENLLRPESLLYRLDPEVEGAEPVAKPPRVRSKVAKEAPAPSMRGRKTSVPARAPSAARTDPTRRRPPPADGANTTRWYAYPENSLKADGIATWVPEVSLWRTTLDRQHKKMTDRDLKPIDDLTGISLRGLRSMQTKGQ